MEAQHPSLRIALKNILFATDFSLAANVAAPFAVHMAKRYGAKVYGVYVNQGENYGRFLPAAWVPDPMERQTGEQTQRLHEQLEGVEHEVVICYGNVWEMISRLIKEKDIDLVVAGTHGRTGLGKVLLGSVAEQILRQAPCPVLTVGPLITVRLDHTAGMREILYATDLTVDIPPALVLAVSLAHENRSRLTLLHVMEGQGKGKPGNLSELAKERLNKLRKLVPPESEPWCPPEYVVECMVGEGIPAEQILRTAETRKVDLIVLEAQPAKALTTRLDIGTVHKVVSRANCPVLTVVAERNEPQSHPQPVACYALV